MARKETDVAHWEREADSWIAWARAPGHDAFWAYRDAFAAFVGPGGDEVLDLGCGEGRVSRLLSELGYRVTACDPVEKFVDAARDLNSAASYAVAAGVSLPFDDSSFDRVVAYNVLMDVEDVPAVIVEAKRVLRSKGELIISIVHPFADIGEFEPDGPKARYVVARAYFGRKRFEGLEVKNGLEMNFAGWSQPLRSYTAALAGAGFAITELEEPLPAPAGEGEDGYANWRRLPLFLWLKARPMAS